MIEILFQNQNQPKRMKLVCGMIFHAFVLYNIKSSGAIFASVLNRSDIVGHVGKSYTALKMLDIMAMIIFRKKTVISQKPQKLNLKVSKFIPC